MNLLVTGAWQQAKEYIYKLEEQGHIVEFLQYENKELSCRYEWIEGIIGNGIFLYHPIEKFVNLKYIQLTSAGYDRVPMKYVKEHKLTIKNARGVYSAPLAEYAIAGVLSLYKKHRFFEEKQKAHIWEKNRELLELNGKKVCIVGCGSVGIECAKRFKAFNCEVFGVSKSGKRQEHFSYIYQSDEIYKILPMVDVVIVALPLTDNTYHVFDKAAFNSMKRGSIFVNIARGALVDTKALIEALMGKLGGAVLDVFEDEPLGDSPLWEMSNTIITPHNSYIGDGNNARMNTLIINNLLNYETR